MNYEMNRPGGPEDDFDRRRPGRGGRHGRRDDRDFEQGPRREGFGPRQGEGPEEFAGCGHRRGGGFGPGRGFGPGGVGMGHMGFGPGGPGFGPGGPGFGPGGPGFGPGGRGARGGGRARRGDVRLAVLALLAEKPLNGYQIIQTLDERTSGAWKPSPGAIYPALNQLEDEGLIAPSDADGQKVFVLTEAGQKAASAIETKPWDTVNDQYKPVDAEGVATFWPEFGKLMMAARSLALSGSPKQVKAATELVQETRRKLFAILAEDDGPES